jgi:hypothetical protein
VSFEHLARDEEIDVGGSMDLLKIGTLFFSTLGLLGAAISMVRIALAGKCIPDRPLHMRMNPFNILASPDRWTPEISALHRQAVRFMLVFVIGVFAFVALSVFG